MNAHASDCRLEVFGAYDPHGCSCGLAATLAATTPTNVGENTSTLVDAVFVAEGWWHPNVKAGQVHDHTSAQPHTMHRLCEQVYTKRPAPLGGVPAAAPERWTQEEIDAAREEGRALSAELAAASDRCLTCGSTDRAVLGPLCAIFGRFGAEPDAWHGGETPDA